MMKKLCFCRSTSAIKVKQTYENYEERLYQEMDITNILKKLRAVEILTHIVLHKKFYPFFNSSQEPMLENLWNKDNLPAESFVTQDLTMKELMKLIKSSQNSYQAK